MIRRYGLVVVAITAVLILGFALRSLSSLSTGEVAAPTGSQPVLGGSQVVEASSSQPTPEAGQAVAPAGNAPASQTGCWPAGLPTGAVSGQPLPVFCNIGNQGPDTSGADGNSWLDEFDHGLSFANFSGTRYAVFEKVGFVYQTLHWRHANHWMVDVASHAPGVQERWVRGGALLRPDRTFRFQDGRLVVEADVAASIMEYQGDAWPEIVISTGARPHDLGGLYTYETFPEDWTVGCRLQASRAPICALKADDGDAAAGRASTRIWEMSAHQPVGTANYGGSVFDGRGDYWRVCQGTNPDDWCRDRFRLELTRTSLTLYVNGHKYFEQAGFAPLPDELVAGDLYVYFASQVVSHPAETVRFHWDRLSVNPNTPPSPAPGF